MGKHIGLLVDDEPDIRNLSKDIFEKFEIELDITRSLDEYEEQLPKKPYDFCVIDVIFPRKVGGKEEYNFLSAAKKTRKIHPDTYIIMHSGTPNVEMAQSVDATIHQKPAYIEMVNDIKAQLNNQ